MPIQAKKIMCNPCGIKLCAILTYYKCVQMFEYPGRFCQHLKLMYEKLLSSRRLPQVKNGSITNELIVEVIRLRTVKQLQWRAVIDKIIQL